MYNILLCYEPQNTSNNMQVIYEAIFSRELQQRELSNILE